MKKLLLKLLGNSIYQPEPIDLSRMTDWLYLSFKDNGFKNYYTMRKKYLVNMLLLDLTNKERFMTLGRLDELRGLSINVNSEGKKRIKPREKAGNTP